ncbi:MAG: hypothetical protein AAF586_03940 [Planctomycetota bacterium]
MKIVTSCIAVSLLAAGSAVAGSRYHHGPSQGGGPCIKFDLRGYGGKADGYTYEQDGYVVDVFAKSIDYSDQLIDAKVGQYGSGLGVTHPHRDGDHEVDGTGYRDILFFDFGQAVKIEKIWFSYVDRHDQVSFIDADLDVLTSGGYYLGDIYIGGDHSVTLGVTGLETQVLGVMAPNRYDDFKVKKIEVCYHDAKVVPTPTAAGLGLIGALGLVARRRRAA